MLITPQAVLPESAYLWLGGYRTVRHTPWQAYLSRAIRSTHPRYFFRHLFSGRRDQRWLDNDCVLESLAQYVFHQFGILLPRENLFKVFNERGMGILPENMVSVIQALVTPLGLTIDQLVVPDAELAAVVASSTLALTDPAGYDALDGQPGVAMINVADGYSHAFFWEAMQARKFSSPRFRIAITLKWCADNGDRVEPCTEESLRGFEKLVRQRLSDSGKTSPATILVLDRLVALLDDCDALAAPAPRAQIDAALGDLLAAFPRCRQRRDVIEAVSLARAVLGADIREQWRPEKAIRLEHATA